MAKKVKQHSQKSLKKVLLKEIEVKLAESLKDYHKKVSERKFNKSVRRAGKILRQTLSNEGIAAIPKKPVKLKKPAPVLETAPEIKSTGQ